MKLNFLNKISLTYIVFFAVIVISKIIMITTLVNATPVLDQWDAEAHYLYKPWLEGTLSWSDLFAAHNEHRIFFTRLMDLVLFEINNKIWDSNLQMLVNAVLHTATLLTLVHLLTKLFNQQQKLLFFKLSLLFLIFPVASSNMLWGFQSQFYFLLLFSIVFLYGIATFPPFTIKWWLALLVGLFCPLTLASGPITLLAGVILILVKSIFKQDDRKKSLASVILLLPIIGIAIYYTPTITGHAVIKSQSIWQFIYAVLYAISWPLPRGLGLIVYVPAFVFVYKKWQKRDVLNTNELFIIGLLLFAVGQIFVLSYARASIIGATRYYDFYIVGVLANLAFLFKLISENKNTWLLEGKKWLYIWTILVLLGFVGRIPPTVRHIINRHNKAVAYQKYLRAYLCTDDPTYIQNAPANGLPFPDRQYLKKLLDNPTIRAILPENIYYKNAGDGETKAHYCSLNHIN